MKMAKASATDINAAGAAMSALQDVGSGYYPARGDEESAPTFFDEEDPEHLRRFYDQMKATLDAAPGWPGRVIGGMCYVILYDKNEIVDPAAETLELHPRFTQLENQRDELLAALERAERKLTAYVGVCAGDKELTDAVLPMARSAIAKVKGGAA